MTYHVTLREPTFDPLLAGDALFRHLLEAVSRPGRVVRLGPVPLSVPPPHLRSACALLLGALDRDATFHVAGPGAEMIREYLRFNTAARRVAIEQADFVLVTGRGTGAELARLHGHGAARRGGVTLVYAPSALTSVPGEATVTIRVLGPGVIDAISLDVTGLDADDLARVASSGGSTPGVDVWLASADGELVAIPRSTTWWIEHAE